MSQGGARLVAGRCRSAAARTAAARHAWLGEQLVDLRGRQMQSSSLIAPPPRAMRCRMSSWWISVRHIWVAIDPHASLAPGYQSSDTVDLPF